MLLGEALLGEYELESHDYLATWEEDYSFTFLAGVTVILTPTLSAYVPEGTTVDIYAGEDFVDMTLCPDGEATGLIFDDAASGSALLCVRLVFTSTMRGRTPVVYSLGFLVQQSTSLYTMAKQILEDALSDSGVEYEIDTELQKYLVPYAWFKTAKHRAALSKVAQACGGVAYQDRQGVIRVEAGNYLARKGVAVVDTINEDRILGASCPVSEVKNRIRIETKPYAEQASTTVWELTGDKKIDSGVQRTFQVKYSDYDAVIDGAAVLSSSPAGASIVSETHYSWGAEIVVLGSANDQTLTLSITGKPLAVVGSQVVERSDGASIRRNGEQVLVIDDNALIQNGDVAGTIADDILETAKDEARDLEMDWRGDPTLELGDRLDVEGFGEGIIVEQELEFNGALSAKARVRKA